MASCLLSRLATSKSIPNVTISSLGGKRRLPTRIHQGRVTTPHRHPALPLSGLSDYAFGVIPMFKNINRKFTFINIFHSPEIYNID